MSVFVPTFHKSSLSIHFVYKERYRWRRYPLNCYLYVLCSLEGCQWYLECLLRKIIDFLKIVHIKITPEFAGTKNTPTTSCLVCVISYMCVLCSYEIARICAKKCVLARNRIKCLDKLCFIHMNTLFRSISSAIFCVSSIFSSLFPRLNDF